MPPNPMLTTEMTDAEEDLWLTALVEEAGGLSKLLAEAEPWEEANAD